jgi:hypothetical protein
MLTEILAHTPLYVWAILAFLVYRGMQASKPREVTLTALCILPLVMLGLSLFGIQSAFGLAGLPFVLWLAGALLGATLAWRFSYPASLSAHPERGAIAMPGSWVPMALMMVLFLMKYAVAIVMAMSPALRHDVVFTAVVCTLYGAFSGIFNGRLLRCLELYRQTAALTKDATIDLAQR